MMMMMMMMMMMIVMIVIVRFDHFDAYQLNKGNSTSGITNKSYNNDDDHNDSANDHYQVFIYTTSISLVYGKVCCITES
jgi:predicted RNA-binding protein (virulence factor B family)